MNSIKCIIKTQNSCHLFSNFQKNYFRIAILFEFVHRFKVFTSISPF